MSPTPKVLGRQQDRRTLFHQQDHVVWYVVSLYVVACVLAMTSAAGPYPLVHSCFGGGMWIEKLQVEIIETEETDIGQIREDCL